MGTMKRPGAMYRAGPSSWTELYRDESMSPDDLKRQQSGFWAHEYRVDKNESVWRCDLRGLEEAVKHVMLDYSECRRFQEDPKRYLDTRFGEGTAYAYFSKHNTNRPYVDLRTPSYMAMDLARGNDMATYWSGNTSTNTTTTTTGTTSGGLYMYDEMRYMRNKLIREQSVIPSVTKKASTPPLRKKLVRTMPFVDGGDSLLATLQREFDHWAKPQMKLLHG